VPTVPDGPVVPPVADADPLAGRVALSSRPQPSLGAAALLTVSVGSWRADAAVLLVGVTPPAGATEMALSLDPSFSDISWVPVAKAAELIALNTGYTEVFARFRATANDTPVASIGGVLVDRPPFAVIDDATKIVSVGRVSDRRIQVVIDAGRIDRSKGVIAERSSDADPKQLSIKDVTVATTDSGVSPIRPTGVHVATTPTDIGHVDGEPRFARRHTVWIEMPKAMKVDTAYRLDIRGFGPMTFTYTDRSSWSPSVQTTQAGFRADDAKSAFLAASLFGENRVDFASVSKVEVVDAVDGSVAFSGKPTRRQLSKSGEYGHGDLTGTAVWELDFSALRRVGRYRVCAPAVGCSYPFVIDTGQTYRMLTALTARAAYRQRSGTALGPPFTTAVRPEQFGPSSAPIDKVSQKLSTSGNGVTPGETFAEVKKASVDGTASVWGGHMDAGDWDQRVQHLWYLRTAIELVEVYPEALADLGTQIPESGDAVPDLIDEGLWSLDFFQRLQEPNGAIHGGLEFDDGPKTGETSWTSKQRRFLYAPDAWSSYIFAGVAAQAARALRTVNPDRSAKYSSAAVAAAEWALAQPIEPNTEVKASTEGQRFVATAALYQLTGNEKWHTEFLRANPLVEAPVDLLECHRHELCDAAWIYFRTTNRPRNAKVVRNVMASLLSSGKASVDGGATTLYRWTIEDPRVPLVWGLGPSTPKVVSAWRASIVTGDASYFDTMSRSVAFSLGANPIGTSFVTGVGQKNPRRPLIVDVLNGDLPQWPGVPVYGFHRVADDTAESWFVGSFLKPAGTTPDPGKWPYLWSWVDQPILAAQNEYTIHESEGAALAAFGVMAARPGAPGR
jgi:endoglucanase